MGAVEEGIRRDVQTISTISTIGVIAIFLLLYRGPRFLLMGAIPLAAGTVLVFILAVGSFVTPVLLGGQLVLTVPMAAMQQFNSTFNWAFGSALVGVLLVAVLATTLLFDRVLKRRLARLAAR